MVDLTGLLSRLAHFLKYGCSPALAMVIIVGLLFLLTSFIFVLMLATQWEADKGRREKMMKGKKGEEPKNR